MVYTWYKKNMFICPKSACRLKLKPYDIFGRVRIQYPMDWENISWLHDPSVSFTRAYHVCNADEWCLWSIQHVIGEKKSLFQVQLGTVDLSTASVDQFFETKGWNGMTFPKFRKLGMYGFLRLPILIYMYLCCLYAISGNSGGIFWSLINIWQQDGWFQRKSPAKWRTTDWPCYNWFQHGTGNVRKKWVRI